MQVVKRDGRIVEFQLDKIKSAIDRCILSTGYVGDKNLSEYISMSISKSFSNRDHINVEEIQDATVEMLLKYSPELSNSYSKYREDRTRIRNRAALSDIYKEVEDLTEFRETESTLENSNKDPRQLFTQGDLIGGILRKRYYMDEKVNPKYRKLHDQGILHIHDSDYKALSGITNCGLGNMKSLLLEGTVINRTKIFPQNELRKAATVFTQAIKSIGDLQYGGLTVSISHLSPIVRMEEDNIRKEFSELGFDGEKLEEIVIEKLKRAVHDAAKVLQYQINTLTSTSGQAPFISIWLDVLEEPEYEKETAMLIEEVLKLRIEGLTNESGYNVSPAFPKLIYCLREENIHEDSKYFYLTQIAAKCSSKRLTPDYISAKKMAEYKNGEVFPCMGCRSFLSNWYDSEGNHVVYGRFNIGVVSINIPYIALSTNSRDEFFSKLGEIMDIARDIQMDRIKEIQDVPTSVAPTLWQHGAYTRLPKDSTIGDAMANGYATVSIGYAGIANAVTRFGLDYLSEEGRKFGLDILKFMNERTEGYKRDTGYGFSLYGTPMESLTQKFARALKVFPKIEGCNDKEYITNSYHVPVTREIDAYSKLLFESEFQKYSPGGCISYVEVPDVSKNVEAVMNLIKFIYENIMYAEINTRSSDVCLDCGYVGEIQYIGNNCWRCPSCGNDDKDKMHVIRRTCGYIGTQFWNPGRTSEIVDRVTHL